MAASVMIPQNESFSPQTSGRLQRRRNALPDILEGCTINELESVYRSLENISTILQSAASPRQSPERVVHSSEEESDRLLQENSDCTQNQKTDFSELPFPYTKRLSRRRNAVSSDNLFSLLASHAIRQLSLSPEDM